MNTCTELQAHLEKLKGKKLTDLHMACEMMMFTFEEYALHTLCLTRIVLNGDILTTTLDYQSWDEKEDSHNDEWYFVEQYREGILGGVVLSVTVSPLHDLTLQLDNGINLELFVKNGYHHYGEEEEQWRFFPIEDDSPHVVVYSKSTDLPQA